MPNVPACFFPKVSLKFCRKGLGSCAPAVLIIFPARKTFTFHPPRSADSICKPAILSPARFVRPKIKSAFLPCSKSRPLTAKIHERPLLIVVRKAGAEVSAEDLRGYLGQRLAKWWVPEEVVFVESLPHTATGKLLKTRLREQYKGYVAAKAE